MGGRQSKAEITEKENHAEMRKRVSTALQKSREKYLSTVLTTSDPNLTATQAEIADAHATGNDAKEDVLSDNGFKPGTGSLEAPSSVSPTVRFSYHFSEIGRDSVFYHQSESSSVSNSSEDDDDDDDDVEETRAITKQPSLSVPVPTRKSTRRTTKRRKKTFRPLGRYDRSSSFHDEVDRKAAKTDPAQYTFFFENLVFEGGGNKGLAYCGAVRYLEELGQMEKITRFAGASAGAMVAGLLAVGYRSDDIQQFLSDRIDKVFLDASCGYLSLLPNILKSFGWNPGTKIYDWFGDKLKDKTGDADFTFMELYKKKGTTLCIIVTNLNQMTTEYCHPKTTPDMPIRLALRMSMAIPGLFSAMKYRHLGQEDVYVDGGVLCNFPVHCFDGWYLSMKPKDSFLRRLHPLHKIPKLMEKKKRFGKVNHKTLGMLLYSEDEEDMLRMSLEKRVGCLEPARPHPETKLYEERSKELRQKQRAEREYHAVVKAVDAFLKVLQKHNMDGNDIIEIHELEAAFKDEEEFPRHDAEVLFGKDCTVNQAFQLLDTDGNGQIHYYELLRFIEETGVSIQSRFMGHRRREIKSFMSFLSTLQSTLSFNVQKLYVGEGDLDRTVGINTGHVHTTDFVLEEPDREFVVLRGYNSMKSFLKYYAVCNPDKVQPRGQAAEHFPDIPEGQLIDGAAAVSALNSNGAATSGLSEDRLSLVTAEDCSLGHR